jgi:hypothetical protein
VEEVRNLDEHPVMRLLIVRVRCVGGDVITKCSTFCIHMPRDGSEGEEGPRGGQCQRLADH